MRIRIYSDLHLELRRQTSEFKERADEDLVVLAGDIDIGLVGVQCAMETFPHVPVVYVLGNHECYRCDFKRLVSECKSFARGSNVQVLERDVFDYHDIRILGATLWTDFEALGAEPADLAMRWAAQSTKDFQLIREHEWRLSPLRTAEVFAQSAEWLDRQIAASDRPTLVVTHHAPTPATGTPALSGWLSSTSFHSSAEHLLRAPVRMWVHGHSHHNDDALINGVRVVTNQWVYPDEEAIGFRPHGLFTFS